MGGLTSKYLEEMVKTPPRNTHILRSDPRSPSDDITRTPISVTDTPEQNGNGTPRAKVLPFDPRSPSAEVNRTPIVVETKEPRRRPFTLKPSKLISSESANRDCEDSDPRSPTSRVPRTPLSDQTHTFTNKENEDIRGDEAENDLEVMEKRMEDEEKEGDNQDSAVSSCSINDENVEAVSEASPEVRLSISGGNKGNTKDSNNPRGMLQARQCRAIEAEYSNNQKAILTQLTDQDTETPTIPSSTQFVESI